MPPSPAPEYIPRKELCRRLHISPSTVYRHGLQEFAVLIGNAVRYDWRSIIEAHRLPLDPSTDEQRET